MPREQAREQTGFGARGRGAFDDIDSRPQAFSVEANAPSDYGNLTYLKTGDYFDLYDDGEAANIQNPTTRFTYTDRPPGNSFNPNHYATDDGIGASYGEATSEIVAAALRLDGQMQQAIDWTVRWVRPDGITAFEKSGTIDKYTGCGYEYCWYTYVYLWSFIGRGFEQGGTPEITIPGTYTVEYETTYGNFSKDVDMVGASVTNCSIPSGVIDGGQATASATVSNSNFNSQYSGSVVAAIPMTDNRTDRTALVLGTAPFTAAPGASTVVDVPIDAGEIGGVGTNTDVEMYAVTDSLNAPVTDGEPYF